MSAKASPRLTGFVTSIAKYAFGIYLLQEIIIRKIYYATPLPLHLSDARLPLAAFVLAFAASFILSVLLSKSKLTRWLLG